MLADTLKDTYDNLKNPSKEKPLLPLTSMWCKFYLLLLSYNMVSSVMISNLTRVVFILYLDVMFNCFLFI